MRWKTTKTSALAAGAFVSCNVRVNRIKIWPTQAAAGMFNSLLSFALGGIAETLEADAGSKEMELIFKRVIKLTVW